MVRPSKAEFLEDHVRCIGEVAISKKQQILREADLVGSNGHVWLRG
jgi:hypothetical protein